MGNGASSNRVFTLADGEKVEIRHIKVVYPQLREDLKRKDALLEEKDRQLEEKDRQIGEKDAEILQLKTEIHQLKSVLDDKSVKSNHVVSDIKEEGNSIFEKKFKDVKITPDFQRLDSKSKFLTLAVAAVRNKRIAVSAESGRKSGYGEELPKHPKSPE